MGTSLHKYSVQFRLSGDKLVPAEITRRLGLSPNQVRIRGEKRGERSVWNESLWSYDGSDDVSGSARFWDSLQDGLSHVLSDLLPKKKLIDELVAEYEAVWWCGHFQSSFDGGPTLSVSLLRQLAEFGVPVFIDNYFTDDEHSERSVE